MSQDNGVLIWGDPQDWNAAIHRFLRECIPQDIGARIENDPLRYFCSNEITYLYDQPVRCHDNQEILGLRELLEIFQQTYPRIRMFHACRTDDVDSYLRYGFFTLDLDKQNQKAKDIFIANRFPQITNEHIVAAARKLNNQGRQNRLYFCLDDIYLINHAPHYLIHGSEYLAAIAAELSRATGVDCKRLLSKIGLPTMFVCDVPLSLIQKHNILHLLVELINYTICEPYVRGHNKPSIDFTFEFDSSLPASIIESYYHPEEKLNN